MSKSSSRPHFDFRTTVSYDSEAKCRFHSQARARLRELAAALGLAAEQYDLRSNQGGIAVMWNACLFGRPEKRRLTCGGAPVQADPLPLLANVRELPRAVEWLNLQIALRRAPNTIAAYGRGLEDYLSFCSRSGVDPERAGRAEVASYVRHLSERTPAHGRPEAKLANATLCQRLTIIRLFYEHLVEEGMRPTNPVGRGAAGGKRAMIPAQRRLPWIPTDNDWRAMLGAMRDAPLRNRLMLALAYDAALRREELCSLETGDFDPSRRTLTLRAQTTKTKRGRCVPYSIATGDLFAAYLTERRALASSRGPLFLSTSTRNRAAPIGMWSWSKIVRALALRAGVPKLTTHSFRHLCLTDLARAGWEVHEIACFAGHRSLQSTLLYIHLSARDLAGKFALGMAAIHNERMSQLREHLS